MDEPATPPADRRAHPVSRFEYAPPVLLAGRGAVSELGPELAEQGIDSVLVVCNRSVGALDAVIGPVEASLGDRFAGRFDGVTADKRLRTAWRAARRVEAVGATGIVGVGAGSALDVATVASALVDSPRTFDDVLASFHEHRLVPLDRAARPLVTVPTTLAGAELSQGAGITADAPAGGDAPVSGGVSDPMLAPRVTLYDAELVAHTPPRILRNSAMNGFNKGIESLYSPAATPVTDASATRGLGLLRRWLPALADAPVGVDALDAILEGTLLVQYGASRPSATTLSVIHAFGHGITANGAVQQGVAHAIVTPHVLRALFARGDCRRDLLLSAFDEASTDGVVEAVTALRDGLGLPARLGSLPAVDRSALPAIADDTAADPLMDNLPPGVSLTRADLVDILEAAW